MNNHTPDTGSGESGNLGVVDHENELDYTEDDPLDYVSADISTSLKINNDDISNSHTNKRVQVAVEVCEPVVDDESEEGELSSSSESETETVQQNNTHQPPQVVKPEIVKIKIVRKKEDLEDGEVDSDEDEKDEDSDEGEVKSDVEQNGAVESSTRDQEDGEILEKHTKPVSDDEEGEIKSDASVEEGEVEETTSADVRPSVEHICRFFLLGQCSWGTNCKFIHKRPEKGKDVKVVEVATVPVVVAPVVAPVVHPAPVIPTEPPVPETAWERGLKKAKEALKKAKQLRVQDADFEDKKMNLSVEDDDFNKENVDNKISEASSALINEGNYDNIQVQFMRGVPPTAPLLHDHKIVEPIKPLPAMRKGRHHTSSSHPRHDSPNNVDHRAPSSGVMNRVKADEWHDPWQRGRSPVRRSSRSVTLSPGHSTTSRSHSGSSRSSYSTVSSRSSRSSASSRSRSRTHSRGRSSSASRTGGSGSESSHSSSSGSRSVSTGSGVRSSRSRSHSSSAGSRGPVRKPQSKTKPFVANNKGPPDISRKRPRSISPQPSLSKKADMRDEKELRAAAAALQQEAKPLQKAARTSGSRREELLKQLKAVEEAIARKRAKQS